MATAVVEIPQRPKDLAFILTSILNLSEVEHNVLALCAPMRPSYFGPNGEYATDSQKKAIRTLAKRNLIDYSISEGGKWILTDLGRVFLDMIECGKHELNLDRSRPGEILRFRKA